MKVDLASEFGVDVYDPELMRSRPWVWLRDLIIGLLTATDAMGGPKTRTARHFAPPPPSEEHISIDR